MSTTAVPSKLPEDFALNIENLDKFSNSTSATFTNRLGVTKKTLSAIVDSGSMALSVEVHATTAAGLAATTTGKYFSVPSGDTAVALILYLNSAGVAVEQKRYPASAALDFKQKTIIDILQLADGDGNLAMRLAAGATLDMQAPLVVEAEGGIRTSGVGISKKVLRWKHAQADDDGNVLYGVDELGQMVANFALVPLSGYKRGGTYDYEVNHVFTYGQSLSVGQAMPVQTLAQKYDNLMFVRGQRPQYDYTGETPAQWYDSLVPAIESGSSGAWAGVLGETPSGGTGDMIKERILAEDGLTHTSMKYQVMLSAPGYGTTTLGQLSKGAGTGHYERMVSQAGYALALANAAGKTYCVQAVTWTQGESDYTANTTQAAYVAALNTLVANFNTDLKAATGQAKSIPLISYQTASHKVGGRTIPNIALGQLEVEAANPLVYIATPMYHFGYQNSSNFHITGPESRWLGAYYGLAYKRIVIDGQDWKPCKPLSSLKQGAIAVIKFSVPSGRLVLDTVNVAANTNYGFELVDSGGLALTISSVSITGPDTVKVIAAAPIPAAAKLRYAWTGTGNVGNSVGPRGNLRDSQGDTIIFDPTGFNKPMHNWCVIFEIGL